ncbi:MAG: hypothetical protein OHK0039_27730 [Bacteroidia bacterium]
MLDNTPPDSSKAGFGPDRHLRRTLGPMIAAWLWLLSGYVPALVQTDSTGHAFWSRIFLPSIEVGYQVSNSSLIGGSLRFGTSIEYRIRNNNDFFIRLNYDTYGARYQLDADNTTTNSIEGKVQFTDILLAPGYRFGDNTFRFVVSAMPGVKLYDFRPLPSTASKSSCTSMAEASLPRRS